MRKVIGLIAQSAIGKKLAKERKELKLSQRAFADKLQLIGLDVDKNAIQRIECGKRFVTDIEMAYICKALGLTPNDLLQDFLECGC